MFVVKWFVVVLLMVALAAIAVGQAGMLKGRAPTNLGVREGRLLPPSTTPNSVSSQAVLYADHTMRAYASVEPYRLKGTGPATIARIKGIVEDMGGEVVKSEPDYLYVQFTTPVMKFVDDAEFWFNPAAGVVEVRSASRLGSKDFGVNRGRVETIRRRLAAL